MSLRRRRKQYRRRFYRGELNIHPSAKLTFEQARYAKCAPVPTKQLAREFGVCPKTIRELRQGVTWRWL